MHLHDMMFVFLDFVYSSLQYPVFGFFSYYEVASKHLKVKNETLKKLMNYEREIRSELSLNQFDKTKKNRLTLIERSQKYWENLEKDRKNYQQHLTYSKLSLRQKERLLEFEVKTNFKNFLKKECDFEKELHSFDLSKTRKFVNRSSHSQRDPFLINPLFDFSNLYKVLSKSYTPYSTLKKTKPQLADVSVPREPLADQVIYNENPKNFKMDIMNWDALRLLRSKSHNLFKNDLKIYYKKIRNAETQKNYRLFLETKYKKYLDPLFRYEKEDFSGLQELIYFQIKHLNLSTSDTYECEVSTDNINKVLNIKLIAPKRSKIKTKNGNVISLKKHKPKTRDEVYEQVLKDLCLEAINFVIHCDYKKLTRSINLQIWSHPQDEKIISESSRCICSISTNREQYQKAKSKVKNAEDFFNRIAKGAYFEGHLRTKKSTTPLIFNKKEDPRFVSEQPIIHKLNSFTNLSTMLPQRFEILIRDLLVEDFKYEDVDVKLTRSTGDGGADIIIFNHDPLRGGKTIVQVKRHNNPIQLSDLRELQGTLISEQAQRGLFFTTSNFASGCFEFAQQHFISLFDGQEILELLKKHGYQATIDKKSSPKAA